MHCYTQCPQPCSRPPLIHASARDFWTLTGKSGSVSCGVTAPFSWVLMHTSFCLCLPRVCFPVLCKFWWLCGGVNGNLPYAIPRFADPESLPLWQSTTDPYLHRRQSEFCLSLCGVSESWCTQGLFEPSEHCSRWIFRKGRGIRDQIANIHWIIEKAREFQKKHLFLLY